LLSGRPTGETKYYFNEYLVKDDKLYRQIYNEISIWVISQNVRMQIYRLCHDDAGYLSVEKTLDHIKQNYWFAGMCRFITKYVGTCLNCAYYKHNAGKWQCNINKVSVSFLYNIDHIGPFETSRKRNKFLFVIIDEFTKFTVIDKGSKDVLCCKNINKSNLVIWNFRQGHKRQRKLYITGSVRLWHQTCAKCDYHTTCQWAV